jgi:osmotically-inducible protein OsmY
MKRMILGVAVCFGLVATSTQFVSCKNKNKETDNTTTTTAEPTAPVEISSDQQLETGVRDAIKDYPGVNATVANGEITLTGTISRNDLSRLMPSLHALNPKKVNNNLTVQ